MYRQMMIPLLLLMLTEGCGKQPKQKQNIESTPTRTAIALEMELILRDQVLDKWYPLAVDTEDGGFLSTFTYDFQPAGDQQKMIVTQARHTWVNARAAMAYPEVPHYLPSAKHGYEFLRDALWDREHGGFYSLVNKKGRPVSDEKSAYGNSFGIYALAAYYMASKDTRALNLAKEAFLWLENGSHDPKGKGYFQDLTREGKPIPRHINTPSTSTVGYKDQNSSIHLLEAFTELYQVWPDSLLRERLTEMLVLIRDTIVTESGYMMLFFHPDWTPVSFQEAPRNEILKHRYIDHVSFGHDVEIAYLMLEASHVLGIEDDRETLKVAKKLIDHSLANGWDATVGGFYDEGYYFKGSQHLEIILDTKNWWAQAEGMNTLLLMSELFPEDEQDYYAKFLKQWEYIQTYLIDTENGDWFDSGTDKDPRARHRNKGHIWKSTYHHYRAMENCIRQLREEESH